MIQITGPRNMVVKRTKSRLLRVLTWLGIHALVFVSASIIHSGEVPEQTGRCVSGEAAEKIRETAVFQRQPASDVRAFSALIPFGWQAEEGREELHGVQPQDAATSFNALPGLTIMDPSGSVMIKWLPDQIYFDPSNSPLGNLFGSLPTGSKFQGMICRKRLPVAQFLLEVLFPIVHPEAQNTEVLEQRRVYPFKRLKASNIDGSMPIQEHPPDIDAITATIVYKEKGITYQEKALTIIRDYNRLCPGVWHCKMALFLRAPDAEFRNWEPVFSVIQRSRLLNALWLRELLQDYHKIVKVDYIDVQATIEKSIQNSLAEHHALVTAVHTELFSHLDDQKEYVNRYTQKIEPGSNKWKYRWTNMEGDVIYSNLPNYDPNRDKRLSQTKYEKTPVKNGPSHNQ